jgi:hypothetical protein
VRLPHAILLLSVTCSLAVGDGGCGPGERRQIVPVNHPPAAPPPRAAANPGCQASLAGFVAGRLTEWRGAAGCHLVDAEAVLGSQWKSEMLGNDGMGRFYPEPPGGAGHVWIWYDPSSGAVDLVTLGAVTLPATLTDQLGPPEAKRPSGLSSAHEQWIYASRGLTAHVNRLDGSITKIHAYAPTTVEDFLRGSLAHERVYRHFTPLQLPESLAPPR